MRQGFIPVLPVHAVMIPPDSAGEVEPVSITLAAVKVDSGPPDYILGLSCLSGAWG